MAAKRALITGITGQDGAYLARFLLDRGYEVTGAVRRSSSINKWRLQELDVLDKVRLVPLELLEPGNVRAVLCETRPDEIYNLAAQSFVGDSFRQPSYTAEVDGLAVLRLLDTIKDVVPGARFYQASTSEMFGKAQQTPQSEATPFHPRSPYGVAKLFAHWTTVNYRESYGMFCTSGILFNHESSLRGTEFLTRKVTLGLARIARQKSGPLRLGNLESRRDWGFAADYVGGMWLMLQQPVPRDYVLATGISTSVRDFVDLAAGAANLALEWSGTGSETKATNRLTGETVVEVDPALYRPAEVDVLVGDPELAKRELGWGASMPVGELVQHMVDADLARVASGQLSGI